MLLNAYTQFLHAEMILHVEYSEPSSMRDTLEKIPMY